MAEKWTVPTRKGIWSGRIKADVQSDIRRYKEWRVLGLTHDVLDARAWLDYVEQNSVPAKFLEMIRRDYIIAVANAYGNG